MDFTDVGPFGRDKMHFPLCNHFSCLELSVPDPGLHLPVGLGEDDPGDEVLPVVVADPLDGPADVSPACEVPGADLGRGEQGAGHQDVELEHVEGLQVKLELLEYSHSHDQVEDTGG